MLRGGAIVAKQSAVPRRQRESRLVNRLRGRGDRRSQRRFGTHLAASRIDQPEHPVVGPKDGSRPQIVG